MNNDSTKHKRGQNEGSFILLASGKWRVSIMINGTRLSRTYPTKKASKEWATEQISRSKAGYSFSEGLASVSQLFDFWLPRHFAAKGSRPRTQHQYQYNVNHYILPRLGNYKLRDVTGLLLDEFYQSLRTDGVAGNRTYKYLHSILNQAFKYACTKKLLPFNPVADADKPKYVPFQKSITGENGGQKSIAGPIIIQEGDEMKRFLAAIRGRRLEAVYILDLATGLREGELLGARWSDLNWNTGEITIERQLLYLPRQGLSFGPPKTDAGFRTIKIGQIALAALAEHQARLAQEFNKLDGSKKRSRQEIDAIKAAWREFDLIFPSTVGTPIHPRNLLADYKRVLEKAGLDENRFHDLRHTALSMMVNHGLPLTTVQIRAGHSSVVTTLGVYSHPSKAGQQEAADLMDQILTGSNPSID